jgi:hypothetical protein
MVGKLIALIVAASHFRFGNALIGSLVGARIQIRLDDNFEQNHRIFFSYRTVFDKSDGMTDISGIKFKLLDYPRGPELNLADKFGTLKIMALTHVVLYPNNFTVIFIDGDMIEGEMEVAYVLPEGKSFDIALLFRSSRDKKLSFQELHQRLQLQHK